jgi:hypothetical protein
LKVQCKSINKLRRYILYKIYFAIIVSLSVLPP